MSKEQSRVILGRRGDGGRGVVTGESVGGGGRSQGNRWGRGRSQGNRWGKGEVTDLKEEVGVGPMAPLVMMIPCDVTR